MFRVYRNGSAVSKETVEVRCVSEFVKMALVSLERLFMSDIFTVHRSSIIDCPFVVLHRRSMH